MFLQEKLFPYFYFAISLYVKCTSKYSQNWFYTFLFQRKTEMTFNQMGPMKQTKTFGRWIKLHNQTVTLPTCFFFLNDSSLSKHFIKQTDNILMSTNNHKSSDDWLKQNLTECSSPLSSHLINLI